MADVSLRIGTKADTSGTKEAAKGVAEVGDSMKHLGAASVALGDILATLAKAGFAQVVSLAKESVKAFIEQERADRMLLSVAGKNTEAFKAQASAMQETLGVSDDMVQGLQTLALRYGVANEDVEKLTRATLDYAAATGQDATAAMSTLLRGIDNGGAGLKKLGIAYESTGDFGKDLDLVVTNLGTKFGGAAKTNAESLAGKIDILGGAWDGMKETFGAFVVSVEKDTGIIGMLTEALKGAKLALEMGFDSDAETDFTKRTAALDAQQKLVGNIGGTIKELEGIYSKVASGEEYYLGGTEALTSAIAEQILLLDVQKAKLEEIRTGNAAAGNAGAGIVASGGGKTGLGGGASTADADASLKAQMHALELVQQQEDRAQTEKFQSQQDFIERWEDLNAAAGDAEFQAQRDDEAASLDETRTAQKARLEAEENANDAIVESRRQSAKVLKQVMDDEAARSAEDTARWQQAGTAIGSAVLDSMMKALDMTADRRTGRGSPAAAAPDRPRC